MLILNQTNYDKNLFIIVLHQLLFHNTQYVFRKGENSDNPDKVLTVKLWPILA